MCVCVVISVHTVHGLMLQMPRMQKIQSALYESGSDCQETESPLHAVTAHLLSSRSLPFVISDAAVSGANNSPSVPEGNISTRWRQNRMKPQQLHATTPTALQTLLLEEMGR